MIGCDEQKELISEKFLYEKEVNEALLNVDCECILWGEDFYDKKMVLYPKKISAIPEYDSIKRSLVSAALVFFDFSSEHYIKSSIVRFDSDKQIVYISEGNFNAIWKFFQKSIDLGIRIQREKGTEISINQAEDILDLTFLERKGSMPIIREGKLRYIAREMSEKGKRALSRKQSLLDNRKYKFYYASDEELFHDKDCECIKAIPPESFEASDTVPEGLRPCKKCRRRMYLREACSPYIKQIPQVDQLLKKGGITDFQLQELVFGKGLKFRIDTAGELTVKGREDTWIITGFDKGYFSLWHNNYVKTGPGERYITQGFHDQGQEGKKLYFMLNFICSYTFDKHLEAENRAKQARIEEQVAEEAMVQREQSLIARIKEFFKKLFKKH